MTRNLKALGLALVAVFAMCAVVSASASAVAFKTFGAGEAILTASTIGEQEFFLTNEDGTRAAEVKCDNVSLDETTVANNATQVTAHPTYVNTPPEKHCTALGFPAQIDMNGCDYLFTAVGLVHIECPTGKQIEVTAEILGKVRPCLDIHAQTPTFPTVEYLNKGGAGTAMDVELVSQVKGITYEKTGLCGSTEGNNADYVGHVTVTGHDAEGNAVGVTVE